MRRTTSIALLLLISSLGACSGRAYDNGIVTRENVHTGLFQFGRDESRVHYSVLWEPILASGTSWGGNFYVNILHGGLMTVNIPGLSMLLLYPFQYSDITDAGANVFGIGSGQGDFRVSLLWGFLSLGREWNLFYLNGFWFGHDDPVYVDVPEAVNEEFATYVVDGADA